MAASQPLRDVAMLMLETGIRPEEFYGIASPNVKVNAAHTSAREAKWHRECTLYSPRHN